MSMGPGGRGGARRRTRRRMNRKNEAANADAAQSQNNPADDQKKDPAADLEKLAELKEKGIITEEEFAAKKKQLLGI
jgi:membrane protease subunit (stomatin/prohibitin family)